MADEEIQVGDKVLTSGGDLIFPKGLLIGMVSKVDKGPEFLQVSVKPAAKLERLEEVLVILKKEEREPAVAGAPLRAADILAQRLPSVPDKPATPAGTVGTTATRTAASHGVVPASAPAGTTNSGVGANPAAQVKTPVAQSSPTPKQGFIGTAGSNPPTLAAPKPKSASSSPASAPANLPAAPAPKPVADTAQPQPNSSGDTPQ
jgi:rod shape-determining protein MreC